MLLRVIREVSTKGGFFFLSPPSCHCEICKVWFHLAEGLFNHCFGSLGCQTTKKPSSGFRGDTDAAMYHLAYSVAGKPSLWRCLALDLLTLYRSAIYPLCMPVKSACFQRFLFLSHFPIIVLPVASQGHREENGLLCWIGFQDAAKPCQIFSCMS